MIRTSTETARDGRTSDKRRRRDSHPRAATSAGLNAEPCLALQYRCRTARPRQRRRQSPYPASRQSPAPLPCPSFVTSMQQYFHRSHPVNRRSTASPVLYDNKGRASGPKAYAAMNLEDWTTHTGNHRGESDVNGEYPANAQNPESKSRGSWAFQRHREHIDDLLRKVPPPGSASIFVVGWENPTGSMKDRMAHAVISRAGVTQAQTW